MRHPTGDPQNSTVMPRPGSRPKTATRLGCGILAGLLLALLGGCTALDQPAAGVTVSASFVTPRLGQPYAALAQRAQDTLEHQFYDGAGRWHMCVPHTCGTSDGDWGADSLTYALWLRWRLAADASQPPILAALTGTAQTYAKGSDGWSDVPMWDSIADAREYQVTHDPAALAKAVAAYRFVAVDNTKRYAAGACPTINYQIMDGGANKLKTLETDSNYVKAALLLYELTNDPSYLREARNKYAAIRRYFLDPAVALYSVYVFDDGKSCTQLPGRYFSSVNGNMIWNGIRLAAVTGTASYRDDALATARAAQKYLADSSGGYAALQAENDISEPLVEAMYDLATLEHQGFARDWLLAAASASQSAVTPDGAYARNLDGPAPLGPVTAWQTNGGLALQFAAGALDPRGRPANVGYWEAARYVAHDVMLGGSPVSFTFTGRAVAIIGTVGEKCCESGHARVFLDGTETANRSGIWQNKSASGRTLPDSVLFAWRWTSAGTHVVEVQPGVANGKEGTSFFHMTGYYVVS